MKSAPILELRDAAFSRGGAPIFEGITLAIGEGDRFALLGPSGCGKSTLLRVIAGLEPPSAGTVHVDGRLASEADRIVVAPHERSLALVFQDLALWPNLSAYENVALGLAASQLPPGERRERAMATLAACRIADFAQRRPAQLSGGQQQRVALARALAVRPKLLLLDEPFTSLDINTKSHLQAEIDRLCTELGLTVILVSHDPLEALALCTSGIVLEGGRVVESGALQALLRDPVSETLRAFVAQLALRP